MNRGIALLLIVAPVLAGCDDDFFDVPWTADPDTALLYALSRPEMGLPSGFDFLGRRAIRIEAVTALDRWDVALDREGTRLVLLPPSLLGVDSEARIAVLPGRSFDEVRDAPGDTASYTRTEPVPVELGSVYVVRTRRQREAFGTLCVHYAKVEPILVDPEAGMLRFVYDVNPRCNDRRLVPPGS